MAETSSSTETPSSQIQTETTSLPVSLPSSIDGNPIMVTNHKLSGTNYLSWSKAVEMFVVGRGKDDYLYGDVDIPLSTDPKFRQWRSENSMVMSWLISSTQPEIGDNFLLYSTAAEIWKAARELYSKRDNIAEIY